MTDESHNGLTAERAAFKTEVLRKLEAARDKGLATSHLLVRRPEELRVAQEAVLAEMVAAGQIVTQHLGKTARYWLPGQTSAAQTPEERADEILRRVLPELRGGQLHTTSTLKSRFLKGLNIPDAAVRTCVRLLEQEKLLLTFTAGTKTYYAYAPALRSQLGLDQAPSSAAASSAATPPSTAASTLPVSNQQVIEAYRAVRQQRQLPDIEIARLRDKLECSLDGLKIAVRRLCEMGILIPGKGDWSFATAPERAAAVMIHNEPHLFVRMKE